MQAGSVQMATTRVQLMSDLHLEIERGEEMDYDKFVINPIAPTLALLGDIGVAQDPRLFQFLRKHLTNFETVLYVLGNHESYRATYVSVPDHLKFGARSQLLNHFRFGSSATNHRYI